MILRRYIMVEILKPAALILSLLVAIFSSYTAVTYLGDAVGGLLSPAAVGVLIGLKIGMALEVLLPTTLYLSVIIALGRLHRDSEMTALAACGVGVGSILGPVLLLALPVAALASFASLGIRPAAYETLYRLRSEAREAFDMSRLEAGRFLELESGRYTLFAQGSDPRRRAALNVHIFVKDGNGRQFINAAEMTQGGVQADGQPVVVLRDGYSAEFERTGGEVNITRFDQAAYRIAADGDGATRYRRKAAPSAQLFGSQRLEDVAELQWRLSIPLSTILLALLGVPLSRSDPRGANFARMGTAVAIFAVYFQLFVIAKTQVENGVVSPAVGIWWVPALLALVVVALLRRSVKVP